MSSPSPPHCIDCRTPRPSSGMCDECKAYRAFLARLHKRYGGNKVEIKLRAERVEVYREKVSRGERLFE